MCLGDQGDDACLHPGGARSLWVRVFLFERGLYVTVVLRLAHFAGRGRVIVIGVPAAWTWPRPIWDASRIFVLALM